jgi:hypothetical protein
MRKNCEVPVGALAPHPKLKMGLQYVHPSYSGHVLDSVAWDQAESMTTNTLLTRRTFRRTVRNSVHSDGRSYRVNTFCPVRKFQHVGFLGLKVGPDAGPNISFTCEHSLSGPASGPTYSCQSNHRQHAAAWYTNLTYLHTQ